MVDGANSLAFGMDDAAVVNAGVYTVVVGNEVGDVTSATLTLPASGDEGIVTVPAGTHTIALV